MVSGHGCFATYLFRIEKAQSPKCEHCTRDRDDSAEHTLVECEAWEAERANLRDAVGIKDLSPEAVAAMIRSPEAWNAGIHFAETVMLAREVAERARQAEEREAAWNALYPNRNGRPHR